MSVEKGSQNVNPEKFALEIASPSIKVERFFALENSNIARYLDDSKKNKKFGETVDDAQYTAFCLGAFNTYATIERRLRENGSNTPRISTEALDAYRNRENTQADENNMTIKKEWLDKWEVVSETYPRFGRSFFELAFKKSEGQTAAFLGGTALVFGLLRAQGEQSKHSSSSVEKWLNQTTQK